MRLIGTQGEPPAVTLRYVALADLQEYGERSLDAVTPIINGEALRRVAWPFSRSRYS